MILKWIKKQLHKNSKIYKNNNLRIFGKSVRKKELWSLTRQSVSTGVSVGLFVAFIPLPIQMVSATILAILFRGNIVIAISTTFVSNPLTFLPINFLIYKVGQLITNDQTEFHSIQKLALHNADLWNLILQFFDWLQSLGKSILVGLPIVSFSMAIISYVLINVFWKLIAPAQKK